MLNQDQQNVDNQAQHNNEEPGNGRVQEDSVFLAALRATAPSAAIAAVGFTVLVYLVIVNILDRSPKIWKLEIADYNAFSGDLAVVVGFLAAVIVWLASALWYTRCTSAHCASRRNYNMINERLDQLSIQVRTLSDDGYGPREQSEDSGSVMLRNVRSHALEQAKHQCDQIRTLLTSKGMPWVTGLGYIELWHRIHRAEEALLKVQPYPDVLEESMRDESRLRNSTMANKDLLLKRLQCAADILDGSAITCEEQDRRASSNPQERPVRRPVNQTTTADLAKALAMLKDIRYEINHFRDNAWEGVVNARNRLAETSVLLGVAAYALLGLAIFSDAPQNTITYVIMYFLIGALTGLFARAQAEWNTETAVDDFGLSTAQLLQVPWLSGLAAVGGVLITSIADAQDTGTEGGAQQLIVIFDSRPILLVVAAIFGLAPDLIIRKLQQQVDKYKTDLQSTQSSQSRQNISNTAASEQQSSPDNP